MPTRFETWPRWAALLVLGLAIALIAAGASLKPSPAGFPFRVPIAGDRELYVAVADRVKHGEGYYHAAAAELRQRWYPTSPAQVFREPTLAWVLAPLQSEIWRRAAAIALSVITLLAVRKALESIGLDLRTRFLAIPLIATATAVCWLGNYTYTHELWAGFLIALSLALYRPNRWGAAVVVGVLACLIRELAFPYLLVMAAFAAYERRRRELLGWLCGILIFSLLFAFHLWIASGLHRPGDGVIASGLNTWIALGGWRFVLETAKRNIALTLLPNALVAGAVCLSLIGFAGTRDPWLRRAGVIVAGYVAAFLVAGRPGNNYWGLLYAPLLPIGIAISAPALRDLVSRALPRNPKWHDGTVRTAAGTRPE